MIAYHVAPSRYRSPDGHIIGTHINIEEIALSRARFFYIDMENVQTAGFNGLDQLSPLDTLIVAYTDQSAKLSCSLIAKLFERHDQIVFKRVANGGPNYADFQIVTMALINATRTGDDVDHVIISYDHGFDRAIETAHAMGVNNICRRESLLSNNPSPRPVAPLTPQPSMSLEGGPRAILRQLGVKAKHVNDVANIVIVSYDKHDYYERLVHKFGQKDGLSFYNKTKNAYDVLASELTKGR